MERSTPVFSRSPAQLLDLIRDLPVPYACRITQATTYIDKSGSIIFDIWKDTHANFPPTIADTISASAKPTISAALKGRDSTLTGWTLKIAAGDVLLFSIDSVTSAAWAMVQLDAERNV